MNQRAGSRVQEGRGRGRGGDTYVVTADQIEDWMINVDGLVYGAYTLRLQRDALPESERAEFDNYVGIHSFSADLP
jgi:uncharacterized protein YegJ (DUF2314 family)